MSRESWSRPFEIEVRFELQRPPQAGEARSLAVLLHGMGQNAAVITSKLGAALGERRHLLVPNGPLPFETTSSEGRAIGHAWYLYTGDQQAFLESAGKTAHWLEGEIDRVVEREGLAPGRVHLVGYSQGGYLAGIMALHSPERYASLSSLCSRLKDEVLPADADLSDLPPILSVHGEKDRFIPISRAQASAESLANRGAEVTFRAFPSGHGLTPAQAEAVASFLDEVEANSY